MNLAQKNSVIIVLYLTLDKNIIDKFINSADYFTIETENVPISVIKYIEESKKVFHPVKLLISK